MTIEEAKNKILAKNPKLTIEKIVDFNEGYFVALVYEEESDMLDAIDPYVKVNKKNGTVSDFSPIEDLETFSEKFETDDDDEDEDDVSPEQLEHAALYLDSILNH